MAYTYLEAFLMRMESLIKPTWKEDDSVWVRENGSHMIYKICDVQDDALQVEPISGFLRRRKWVPISKCLTYAQYREIREMEDQAERAAYETNKLVKGQVPPDTLLSLLGDFHTAFHPLQRMQGNTPGREAMANVYMVVESLVCHINTMDGRLEVLQEENKKLHEQLGRFMKTREGRY